MWELKKYVLSKHKVLNWLKELKQLDLKITVTEDLK